MEAEEEAVAAATTVEAAEAVAAPGAEAVVVVAHLMPGQEPLLQPTMVTIIPATEAW